jgi:hypothetical protein
MEPSVLFTVANLIILLIGVYISYRRSTSQGKLEGSEEEMNYRTLYVGLKADIKTAKEEAKQANDETKELKEMMKKNRLLIALAIEMGGTITLESYEWFTDENRTKTEKVAG